MTWSKLKENIEDNVVKIAFAAIAALCLIIWQAIPTQTWTQLGTLFPKRALAAIIGLLLILLATLAAYSFSLRRQLKGFQTDPNNTDNPNEHAVPLTHTYEPNDVANKILRYLSQDNHDPYHSVIMQHLEESGVPRIAAVDAMNELLKHAFVHCTRSRPSDPFPRCRLKENGIKYALEHKLNEPG